MFMNFRRISKRQCVQMLTTGLVLCVLMVCREKLNHHVVSHVIAFSYRYLVNSYDFLDSSLAISSDHHSSISVDGRFVNHPYLINHPGKCKAGDGKGWDDVLLLLFVKSAPENFDRRRDIRDTWGNESFVWSELGVSVRHVFAMGVYSDVGQRSRIQNALLQEDRIHGDLIQQNFVDTFHNLTTKLLLQFHWSQTYCPQAHFVMSADDDVFVHMPNLVKYLQQLLRSQLGAKDLWVGHVYRGAPPIRHKDSKYHVPYGLYPWPSYPDYTAGAGYVVSGDVAAKIYQATLVLNTSLYIDDVFMGVCAKVMGVSPQQHGYFSGEGKAPYHPCIYDHMITSHGHAADVRLLWQAATDVKAGGMLGKLYCTAVRVMLLCLPYYHTYPCLAAFT
ncbi:lactosylceramide 1,3-N-acetyl-beta-D-glucosaminyltransferase A [Melanotaenia boesemani]|uniref:lactosylceramide 1,3-N-acetyl-beta-D-glucosaminyltransferase A n=1 Tax=Melanotaenia boesemani TaxID=1250792 RepID=UPI001C054425|nr:lactosylceramide 1,3-N-acetyl-beta-D-glucosaminyltransferase A [Melanotaenia boesemani]